MTPRRRLVRFHPKDDNDGVAASEQHMTTLYRHAREQSWESLARDCRHRPDEARYVCPETGTTALHLTVMSRVELGDATNKKLKVKRPAPLSLVEQLLQIYPEAAKIKCKMNTYTPLAYACLVSSEHCLEETDYMVRLFLKYCPDCTSVYTAGGLSALDVHIMSYSQAMVSGKQDEGALYSGRTDTLVLRTLLETDPSLAKVRIARDKVGGAIEILYRCNSEAFLKVVAQYERKTETTSSSSSPLTRRNTIGGSQDKTKSVVAQISRWWVWRWTICILKYGTLPHKKKGARFSALQAACGVVGCPLPVITLAVIAFPDQIRAKDEMHGDSHGNLPLHEVCSWPCAQDFMSSNPVISSRKGMAISALLQRYPVAACVCNHDQQTPLDLAISSGTTWDGGIRKLVRAYPSTVSHVNAKTGFYPFVSAAETFHRESTAPAPIPSTTRDLVTYLKNMAKWDLQSVRTIYGLLRADPIVLDANDVNEDD